MHAGNSNALNVFMTKSTHITLITSFPKPNRNTCVLYTDKTNNVIWHNIGRVMCTPMSLTTPEHTYLKNTEEFFK